VLALGEHPRRVLVSTDCLSEGINLQDLFDAVLHYDLSWNPTRHEQREGRVDRYGQPRDTVRALTYWGRDNGIDGLVLDVLLRKHKTIRSSLGVSVPVPPDTDALMEAILEGLVLRGREAPRYEALQLFDDATLGPRREAFFGRWEAAAAREKRSRTMFAQETIKVDEVGEEVDATRAAIGSGTDVRAFVESAVPACGGVVSGNDPVQVDLTESPLALRDRLPQERLVARFELPVSDGQTHLARTHPVVETLASHLVDGALDPLGDGVARRAGVIRTEAVAVRTTVLLVRLRYDVVSARGGREHRMLAEECRLLAFEGSPAQAEWLPPEQAEPLLRAMPCANVESAQAAYFVGRVVEAYEDLAPGLAAEAERRAAELLEAHRRVRVGARGGGMRVEAQLPPDVLGIYLYLPPVPG
jgi:Helicase conserved C-terminal domain